VNRDSREDLPPGDNEKAEDFKLAWAQAEDRWTEVIEDKGEFLVGTEPPKKPESAETAERSQWVHEESTQQVDEGSIIDRATTLLPDSDQEQAGPKPDDEAPPQGDPLDRRADEVFEGDRRAGARMDSLQDALSSIRERVQSLSSSVQATGPRAAQSSQLALYRAATDDRTYAEVRRHSKETEEHLRRVATLMQDLSLDLRSIVDAARRAIDQTSEQAESSIELGRLLGERIEQMDDQLSKRIDGVAAQRTDQGIEQRVEQLGAGLGGLQGYLDKRIEQLGAGLGGLQGHLDKRLTKLEQRAGVGVVREEIGELRTDLGEVRADLGSMRTDLGGVRAEVTEARVELGSVRDHMGVVADSGTTELEDRLNVLATQLDRTLGILRDFVEGESDQGGQTGDAVVDVIRAETEAAVEPFRNEVEQLGQLLSDALGREEQMTEAMATLTDEVQRLRKRIPLRAGAKPSIDDDQIQSIVDAVVVGVQGRRPASTARRRSAPEPPPEDEDEFAMEPEPQPAPRPVRAARKKRASRPVRAKKAPAPPVDDDEPEYELDINEPFAEGELDLADAVLDVEPEEEPIRRARGEKKRASRPLTKGRRPRSSSR